MPPNTGFQRERDLKEFESIQSHGGLGLSLTDKGIFLNVVGHFAAYSPSSLCVVGALWGGYWTWLTFVVGWVIVPIVDLIIGADSYNLTEEEEKKFAESTWFRFVTWFHLPVQIAVVTWCAQWVALHPELSWLEWLGITFSVGTAQGFGIGCVHELIHRPARYDFMNGVVSLCFSNYGHFWIEHLWGHHRNVASPLDPASSDVGDNVWTFVPKCMWNGFFEAWDIESKILKSKGKTTFSSHNRIIRAYLFTWAIAAAYAYAFSVAAVPFFFAQGFIAAWIVDNTNYIEHYGLRRKEVSPGVYERVGWLHAWDTPEMLSNSLLFKIQRHPDHHTNANRPYQILRTYPQAPTLPTGYAGMIALSWFPPLFWYVMDWRVALVKDQDREFRATGKLLGEPYPFPDGARAVYSFDGEADKLFQPSAYVEKASSNQPRFDQYKALKEGRSGVSQYSRNKTLRVVALLALVLTGVGVGVLSSESGLPARLAIDKTLNGLARPALFERLGATEKIKPLVATIYNKHVTDPITAKWFEGVDHPVVERHVVEFFSAGTGGNVEYTGKDMLEAHQEMAVTGDAFLAVQDHVITSMIEHQYDAATRDEVLGILFSLRPTVLPNLKPIAVNPDAPAPPASASGPALPPLIDQAVRSLPRPALFDRLGGLEKIKPLVATIYNKHKTDPISAKWFEGVDHALVESRVVEFFSAGTGGNVEYTGKDMVEAHKDMKLTGEAFLAVQDHVMTSMVEHQYDAATRDEVLGILFSLRPQVLPNLKPIPVKAPAAKAEL